MRSIAAAVAVSVALAAPAAAQTASPPPRFEIAAGPMYGLQDPERPVTPGWIVSSGFRLGGQLLVVEGAWHRESHVDDHLWGYNEVFRRHRKSLYWTLQAGVRSGPPQGRVGLYYQLLAGGFAARFRTDNEWPASIDVEAENAACGFYANDQFFPCENLPYPAFREERAAGVAMQPGIGLDVRVWRRLTLRMAADLPILAGGDYVVLRPKLSAQVVAGLGR